MYANVAQSPVFAGQYAIENAQPLFVGQYAVEPAQPLFAGYEVENAQPLFAGLDDSDRLALAGLDPTDYPSMQGVSRKIGRPTLIRRARGLRGFGQAEGDATIGGTAVAIGIGALVVGLVVSFGVSVLASYTGARLAGCRRQ